MSKQYIGARYVPTFSDVNGGEWSNEYSYEALTIVSHGIDFYTSKIPVPVGVDISNTEYWVKTGEYNGAINTLEERIDNINEIVSANKYFVTPEDYGAVADGITDCTSAIQQALDENPSAPIYFGDGIYLIKDTLYCKEGIHFYLAPKAQIKLDAIRECMIYDNIADAQGDTSRRSYNSFILGGILNGNGKCNVVLGFNYEIGMVLRDLKVMGFNSIGICCGYNIDHASDVINGACNFDNLYITNDVAGNEANTYGIYSNGQDNYYNNLSIVDCKTGISTAGGSSMYNVHPWIHAGFFEGSTAFEIKGATRLVNCVSDGCQYGIKVGSTGTWLIVDNFRFAFHIIPAEEVTEAGGFQFFVIPTGMSYRMMLSNIMCQVDNDYPVGKIIDDYIYNSKHVYDNIHIKNMIGTTRFPSMSNIIYPDIDNHYDGVNLNNGDDLNDFLYPGKWTTPSIAIGTSISNKPSNNNFNYRFTLICQEISGHLLQTCISASASVSNPSVAMRMINKTTNPPTYGAWKYVNGSD